MTRMGFDKLQKLKEEMHSLASKGKPIQHLQEQKSNLKEKVVEKFKLLYSAKMLRSQNKSLGSHWKHAAEEIVNVLHRIRAEGESTIQDLEEELIRIEKAITRQAENMVKLEHTVQEKQKTIDTINKSMSVSNNENELLKSEVERYQDQVIMMKKELRKLRADGESQDLPESVDNHSQTFLSMVTLINAVNDEISAASMVKGNSLQSQLPNDCQCSSEIPQLLKKIDTLQQKIIDKETQMLMMDHQSIDTADSKEEAERRKDSKKPEGREHNTVPTIKIQMEPVVQDVPSEVSEVDYVHDDMKLRLLALTQDKEQLLMEMDKLREQNAQAAREIVTLKYASEQPYMATSSFPRTDQYGQRLEPSQHARKSLDSVNEQYVQSDVPSLAEEDKAEVKLDTLKSEPINDVLRQSKVVTDRSKQGNTPDQLPHQNLRQNHQRNDYKTPAAYQTDWSSVQEKRRSQLHRVPMEGRTDQTGIVLPPVSSGNVSSKYMQFPTKGFLPPREAPRTQSKRRNSKVDAGMGPEAVENHENELQSFVGEIQSYSQYLKDAMDGEIYRMAQANEELRRRLSEQSLRQFDKLYSTLLGVPESLDETSSKSSEYSGQMMRGRIRAPKVPSPFTAEDAFATIKKGERIVRRREFEREENHMLPTWTYSQGSHQPQNDLSVYQATQRVNPATMKSRSEDQRHAGSFDKGDVYKDELRPSLANGKNLAHFTERTKKKRNQQLLPDTRPGTQSTSEREVMANVTMGKRSDKRTGLAKSSNGQKHEWSNLSQRTAGVYVAGKPDWERKREQYQAGIKSIQGLTGTSILFKQALAQQFTRHFCLSEVKRAKEVDSVRSTVEGMTRTTMNENGIDGGEDSNQPIQRALSMTSLFRRMATVLEGSTEENESLLQGQEQLKLPQLVQTKSLNSLETSHKYSTSILVHPFYDKSKRLLFKLPTAKYPGRGYVVLQTERFPVYHGQLLRNNKDEKPLSHRPVCKSHKQLNTRHRMMVERQLKQVSPRKGQTLWNVLNSEDGLKFDPIMEENSKDGSESDPLVKDIIKTAHDQLFNPDHLQHKYNELLTNDKPRN
ncbi:uncharacterized protein [Apostichopus japonicus]|uniref:uncharacterized protein n=1 Tax=Stichopus japonicus TaxID=307972 RepID=UPI003AB8B3AF